MPRYHYRRRMDDNINSIDDCIEGIEEPLYGFRTNITLLRDSPCILGYTCDNPSTSGTENIIILQVFISNSHQIFFFIIVLWTIEFECEMISFQTDTFMESNTHTTLIYWLLNLIFSTKQYYWLVLNFVSYKKLHAMIHQEIKSSPNHNSQFKLYFVLSFRQSEYIFDSKSLSPFRPKILVQIDLSFNWIY